MRETERQASELALLEQFRNRDPKALESLYDQYSTLVYSLFLRITRDRSTAEDLVQELFIRIWNRARDFDPSRGALGVWILSVARNMGIDYVRSAQARFAQRLQPMDAVGELPGKQRIPESLIDDHRTVQTAFQLLNPNQRRVLELAYFEGLSQSEIADRLQEPLGTVKTWVRSALQSVRSAMTGRISKEARQ